MTLETWHLGSRQTLFAIRWRKAKHEEVLRSSPATTQRFIVINFIGRASFP
jgi:hypothetical protein